jgi:hypothetical protein
MFFFYIPDTIPVYVPCDKEAVYKSAEGWNYFSNIIEDCTGIEELTLENQPAFYPNPATDNVYVTLPENVHSAFFTLYDMQGKMLMKQEVRKEEIISVGNLAAGMYIYNVRTDKQNYQGKMIIKN